MLNEVVAESGSLYRAMDRMPFLCGMLENSAGICFFASSRCSKDIGMSGCRPPTTSAICATNPLSTRKKWFVLYSPIWNTFSTCR